MMWTEDDEEKYNDMNVVECLTEGKRGVMGKFPDSILIKEKPMKFIFRSFFNDKIGLFLPEKEGNILHIGSKAFYPSNMGEYVEKISEDNNYFFTIEQDKPNDKEFDVYIDEMCEDINYKYQYTKINKKENYIQDELKISVMLANIFLDEDFYCLIFVISKDNDIYRLYFSCKDEFYKPMVDLAYKIVNNICIK